MKKGDLLFQNQPLMVQMQFGPMTIVGLTNLMICIWPAENMIRVVSTVEKRGIFVFAILKIWINLFNRNLDKIAKFLRFARLFAFTCLLTIRKSWNFVLIISISYIFAVRFDWNSRLRNSVVRHVSKINERHRHDFAAIATTGPSFDRWFSSGSFVPLLFFSKAYSLYGEKVIRRRNYIENYCT